MQGGSCADALGPGCCPTVPDPAVTSSVPRKPPLHHDKPRRPARSCCPSAQRPVQPVTVQRSQRRLHVACQIGNLTGNMQSARRPLFSNWLHTPLGAELCAQQHVQHVQQERKLVRRGGRGWTCVGNDGWLPDGGLTCDGNPVAAVALSRRVQRGGGQQTDPPSS